MSGFSNYLEQKEKLDACLREGKIYIEQARKAVGADERKAREDDYVIEISTMLGQLAADQVRSCLKQHEAKPTKTRR